MEEAVSLAVNGQENPSPHQPQAITKLYPLDQQEIELQITAGNLTLQHKLRRPELEQLEERDSQTPLVSEEVSNSEDRFLFDDEWANARLWDKVAAHVKGYRLSGYSAKEWIPISPSIAALIPSGHKATAIRGMYAVTSELEQDEEEGFALGSTTYIVKQKFNEYIIRHYFRPPTENERRDFRRRSSETRFRRGGRKAHTTLLNKLRPYVELYNALILDVDGIKIGDEPMNNGSMAVSGNRDQAIALMDPIWKRSAIDALMRWFEASLSD
jgi:hypothetical protein